MRISILNSVRAKIIIAVVIMVSIPFGMLQFANVLFIYDKLHAKTEYTTEALAHSIATNVSEFMQGVYDSSGLLARNEKIVNGEPEGQSILADTIKRMPYYRLFYVQDINGAQTLRSSGQLTNRSDRWWFKKITTDHEPFVSQAYVSVNNNELITSIFLPMYKEGKVSGVFGADFTLETIQNAAGLYWNKDITYVIMDSKGSVLTSTDYKQGEYINYIDYTKRTVVLDKNNKYKLDENGQIVTKVEKIEVSDTMKRIVSGALDNKTESYKFKDGKGNIVVCAYQPIKLPGKSESWSVIVFQKETDNFSIVLMVSIIIFLILCSIFITYKLIDFNILNPVLEIQRGMAKIVEGKLDVRVDSSKQNEIGKLAGDINKMVDSLKRHQQKIDEDEKMVALGNLVAGVAHEINTPLGIGVTTATYMKKINDESRMAINEGRFSKKDLIDYMESMDESLDLLKTNLERGAYIIQSFKRIAVDQTYETEEEFNVPEYIDSVVTSLTHEYKKSKHTFNISCDQNLTIRSYPGIFAQILTNLIMNSVIHAFDGMENGQIDISALLKDGRLILRYSDNGCGISRENLQKVFTPFFTTRKGLGGSGLGLNIIHNLITKKLNGTISVESEVGKGTTFIIVVPV